RTENYNRVATVGPSAHGNLQRLARGEADDAALGNFDGVAGAWIAGHAGAALRGFEGAEADECDRIALPERPRDAVQQRVDGSGRAALGGARVAGDLGD